MTALLAHLSAPTDHKALLDWVSEVTALTTPAEVHWCDGSDEEQSRLTDELVINGTLIQLDAARKPHSFYARTDPGDVARVEDRTFICSKVPADAGPTNNWMDPIRMKSLMTDLYRGSMLGRTMYVIPFCMGPLDAETPMFGVEITDSAYVAVSMRTMTRTGSQVLAAMTSKGDAEFVPCLHSVGAPLEPGQEDVAWPCSDVKYISHFPEERAIWSFGSGYGGNSLLGKKCYSLRIASAIGRQEGWLAEHMLIIKLISPLGRKFYIAAAFPSACGKTNLAMLQPTIPGWRVETLGDDIAWLRFGRDGRLYATNPEAGLFGVAPGTSYDTNPQAMEAICAGHTLFTNVALTGDGDVWWEGLTPQAPSHLIDWRGESWNPDTSDWPAAHPNSRFCTPLRQCPSLSDDYDNPEGVPLDAIIFGGRRKTTVPLVVEARDWTHGVFLGATLSSETTAAAAGQVGIVRRDPMAMLPFLGYHAGDYFQHWLDQGERPGARLPQIFNVNWFRRSEDGGFLWPGFGENSRVLAWVAQRLTGEAGAVQTPIGWAPTAADLNLIGIPVDRNDVNKALAFNEDEWRTEVPLLRQWFESIGAKLPQALSDELDQLADDLHVGDATGLEGFGSGPSREE